MFLLQTLTMIPFVFLIPVGILGVFSETFNAVYRVIFVIVCVVLAVLQLLYWPWMESSSRQATLGKRALDIVVTDTDGRRVSFARAAGRNLAKIASYMIYGVGFIMIAFTKKKQGLHDMIASTLVVVKK